MFISIHFNNPLVALVSNQDVAVRQKSCSHGYVELVEACAGHASVLTVLPNNGALLIHHNDAIVRQPFTGSEQPGRGGVTPPGMPVPEMSVNSPTRSASFVPTMECGPGLSAPSPKVQTTLCVSGSISMTRLLN